MFCFGQTVTPFKFRLSCAGDDLHKLLVGLATFTTTYYKCSRLCKVFKYSFLNVQNEVFLLLECRNVSLRDPWKGAGRPHTIK